MKIVNGDPLTFGNEEYKVRLNWFDRMFNDQLTPYNYWNENREGINEKRGWTEYMEFVEADDSKLELRWWVYRSQKSKENQAPIVVLFEEFHNTSWQHVADDEGLVILAFEYHRNLRLPESGEGTPGFSVKQDELDTFNKVIERTICECNADRSRLYVTGRAYGEMIAMMYAKNYPGKVAAMALISGACSPYNIKSSGFENISPVPVIHICGDQDIACDGYPAGVSIDITGNEKWLEYVRSCTFLYNRDLWININGCDKDKLSITSLGGKIFFRYDSSAGDVIFNETAGGSIAPSIDYAYIIWNMLFRRYKRNSSGELIEHETCRYEKDCFSVALAAGKDKAYFNGKTVELGADCLILSNMDKVEEDHEFYGKSVCRGDSFYASLSLLDKVCGIKYEIEDLPDCSTWYNCEAAERISLDDFKLKFLHKGNSYEVFSNTCIIKVNGEMKNLGRPLLVIDGNPMFPVAELMKELGYFSSFNNDAVYITDHEVSIGYIASRIIREELLTLQTEKKYCISKINEKEPFEILQKEVLLGESTTIVADEGVVAITAYMNGVKIPVWKTASNRFEIYNIFGNVEIKSGLK